MNFSSLSDSNSIAQLDRDAVDVQLRRILSSTTFARSPRSRELLDYLVRYALRDSHRPIKEMTIGIELFRRDSASYRPDEDPIVRVQAGRLRQRLDGYYTGEGRDDRVRISLPGGSYAPAIVCGPVPQHAGVRVVLMPVAANAPARAADFAAGLDDELQHGLHCDFGHLLVSGIPAPERDRAAYVVQGSVRADNCAMRAQLSLLQMPEGIVIWSEQDDVEDDPSIARQTRLAQLCRVALRARLQAAQ
jgi:hypothetical protein